jgi:hypothetical protein
VATFFAATPLRHLRERIYSDEDKRAVLCVLKMFDHISSKRLREAMDAELATLISVWDVTGK